MSVENTRISAKDIWEIESETDWERVRAMTDEDIEIAIADDPDTIDTDEEFWKDAVFCSPFVNRGSEIKSRLGRDVPVTDGS